MAHALKFKTVVSGKTLTLSDLDAFVGKHVEVTVAEDESMNADDAAQRTAPPVKRHFGTMAGKLEISDDFDQPLPPDIQRYFEVRLIDAAAPRYSCLALATRSTKANR